MNDEEADAIEKVIRDMDGAFSRHDVDGLVALFAEDATLESPLVSRI